jgi:flagellar basal-body rod protein FlgF
MRTASYVALSRQTALERQMAIVANNLANATTTGYRAEHAVFDDALHRAGGGRQVAYVHDAALSRDLAPGPIERTGNPFDVALDGPGYLAFATEAGTRYGRAGRLEVAADGTLVDAQGHALLDDGGNAIVLPEDDTAITVAGDGTISGRDGPLARVGLAAFADEQALRHAGGGLLAADAPPVPAAGVRVVQGALEGSNVRPVLELTTMLASVRAFESAQRLLDSGHELERQAIERAGRAAG